MAAAAAGWTVEDDVALKSAVEAGASLESLAKGAVCFSHKFTLQELQDRWYSLLYDSETSAQASARMAKFEAELWTSNPAKASKLFNSKAKGFSVYKRKIDSVKIQYYARRKRICHEPCLSADFGYVVVPCSCIQKDDSGCACGCQLKCSEDHQLVDTVDPSGGAISSYGCVGESYADGQYVQSGGNGQCSFNMENANSDGSIVIDGDSNHGSLKGYSDVDQLYGFDYMQKNPQTSERSIVSSDNWSNLINQHDPGTTGLKALPIVDQDGINHDQFSWNGTGGLLESGSFSAISGGWCSQAPGIPTWSKLLGVCSPKLTDMHRIDEESLMLSDDKMEMKSNDALAFQANLDGSMPVSGLGNAMMSELGLMHSNLKGSSEKEVRELLSSEHVLNSAQDTNQEDVGDSHSKVFLKGSSRGPHSPSSDTTNCGSHINPIQKKHNVTDVSGVDTVTVSDEVLYSGCHVECILNTEDSEIPFNDHIPIPCQSSLQLANLDQDSPHDMFLIPSKPINMENVVPSTPPPPTKLEPTIEEQREIMVSLNEGCIVGNVPPGNHCDFGGNNADVHTKVLHSVDEGEETTCGLFQLATQGHKISHTHSPDTEFHNSIASMSTLGQAEGSDSESSVPDYFDLEALILDLDLIPRDQESDFIQPEVSRFHSPEGMKDLVRLEKGACSYMNRSIMSKGALAIIYGQRLRYYIRDTEVTLGRETEEVHVDIDLAKEGKANKISRRQAVIKMDDGGSFYMKNIGKGSIFVNSKEVPCNKRILLTSDSLIEIRKMKFIFHVNHNAVRQHIVWARRGNSEGMNATFDWTQKL